MHMILNEQSQYWYKNLMKGSRKVEFNFKNITFILLIMKDMYILISLIFIQKIFIVKYGYFKVKCFIKNKEKSINQRISVYGATSLKEKFLLVFFTGNMDSKKLNSFRDPAKY